MGSVARILVVVVNLTVARVLLGHKVFLYYIGSLAPADFSGAVFTFAHFQKIATIYSLCEIFTT